MKISRTTLAVLGAFLAQTAVGADGPPPPPEVSFITVEPETVPVWFEYIGITEESKRVEIRSRIQGFLESRDFDEGLRISEGTLLFTIDPRPFQADVEVAKAQVAQAETRLRLAEQEVNRLQSVTVPGAIAASDVDKQMAEQANAAASLRLAKAQLAKAELELGYTTVSAPLDGYIGKALKEIGSLVDAGQNSLLAVMSQVDPMYVSFRISEREYLAWRNAVADGTLKLAEGDRDYLEITLLDGTVYPERGAINFEDVAVSLETGSVELRATFTNPEFNLKPGQFVKARVMGWVRPNTIAVPQAAVSQSPQGAYVYVIGPDDKAELRHIETGTWSGKDWIVDHGLSAGDHVIVEGLVKVQPGLVVNPTPYTEQGARAHTAPMEPGSAAGSKDGA